MSTTQYRDTLVVGGGISGTTAASRLSQRGVDVALIEARPDVGGCMTTEHRDGFILEKGPFNVLVRDEAFHEMLDDCAAEVPHIAASEQANARYVMKGGSLHKVPTGPGALIRSPLLSFGAKLRLLRGMLLSAKANKGEPTIADAAERRLGAEVADTFISSIVAGVFGGDSRLLSLKACFPKAWRFDQARRSPLLYEVAVLREKKKRLEENPAMKAHKGLISFKTGLQSLPQWLARQLGDNLFTNRHVESIEHDRDRYTLRCHNISENKLEMFACRRLVLATPAHVAGDLLHPLRPTAAELIKGIKSSSLVVLNLAYPARNIGHPMSGYGFLVPASEKDTPVMGVLWADSAFPHHGKTGDRIVRVFLGGPRDPEAVDRSEPELLEIATNALQNLLDISGEPSLVDVCRWKSSIPQYYVGHTERVDRVLEDVGRLPNVHLVGNYLRGVSINDCVGQATRKADEIARSVSIGHQTVSPAHLNGTASKKMKPDSIATR